MVPRVCGKPHCIVVTRGGLFHIPIAVESSMESNWITRDVPPGRGIIIPIVVVMQPRLLIKILPRKPQIKQNGHGVRSCIPTPPIIPSDGPFRGIP
jgi:hypothetical protein